MNRWGKKWVGVCVCVFTHTHSLSLDLLLTSLLPPFDLSLSTSCTNLHPQLDANLKASMLSLYKALLPPGLCSFLVALLCRRHLQSLNSVKQVVIHVAAVRACNCRLFANNVANCPNLRSHSHSSPTASNSTTVTQSPPPPPRLLVHCLVHCLRSSFFSLLLFACFCLRMSEGGAKKPKVDPDLIEKTKERIMAHMREKQEDFTGQDLAQALDTSVSVIMLAAQPLVSKVCHR